MVYAAAPRSEDLAEHSLVLEEGVAVAAQAFQVSWWRVLGAAKHHRQRS